MTLFVVSLVLLVLIMRDQHRAIATLEDAHASAVEAAAAAPGAAGRAVAETAAGAADDSSGPASCRATRPPRARTSGTWSAAGSRPWAA